MADLKIVISALNKASKDIAKVKSDIEGVGKAGKGSEGGVKGLANVLGSTWTVALSAGAAIFGVATAIKSVYDAAKEGAELEYVADKFDRLTTSVGATSDALLGDLRSATGGMRSDAELMASATDFMALGFAKTKDEVVRLTTVAGALNMNMNQLVLTLANQTTMRFDQLGVSVDGFDEKVAKLKETGMSASDAFQEAFLQQAEEQIDKVGGRADSTAGSFDRLAAAIKNMADAAKENIGTAVAPVVDDLANGIENLNYEAEINNRATEYGISLYKQVPEYIYQVSSEMNGMAGAFGIADGAVNATSEGMIVLSGKNKEVKKTTAELAAEVSNYETKMADYVNAAKGYADGNIEIARSAEEVQTALEAEIKEAERLAKIQTDIASATSMTGNFKNIVSFATQYTQIQGEINAKQAEYDAMPGWKKASKDGKQLLTDIENLKSGFKSLADQMTLDMFSATIAVGGVTGAEMEAYLKMAVDMGVISQDAADAAIAAYGNAIDTINGYKIDDKTGNVTADASAAFAVFDMLEKYVLLDKEQRVFVKTYYGTVGEGDREPGGNAVGGSVQRGNPYTWQEYGYRGELFIPSQDGYVLSRAEAERALARAASSDSGVDTKALASAVAGAVSGALAVNKQQPVYNGPSTADLARAVRDALLMARAV